MANKWVKRLFVATVLTVVGGTFYLSGDRNQHTVSYNGRAAFVYESTSTDKLTYCHCATGTLSQVLSYDMDPLINITSMRDKTMFSVVAPEKKLTNFSEATKLSQNPVNNFNFPFILPGKDICAGEPPFLLLMILSTVKDSRMREQIRSTWLNAAEVNDWPRYSMKRRIVHVFVLGINSYFAIGSYKARLHAESSEFKDIILADFHDSYRNLSIKVLTGLTWVLDNCKQAQFVLKVDMDTMVNIPQMVALISNVSQSVDSQAFVLGRVQTSLTVRRSGKWAVPTEAYPLVNYPYYMLGHTYVVGAAAIPQLLSTAQRLPILAPEDVFITGVVAKKANVTRLGAPSFTANWGKLNACDIVWARQVAITPVKSAVFLKRLWDLTLAHRCNPGVDFRYNRSSKS